MRVSGVLNAAAIELQNAVAAGSVATVFASARSAVVALRR